MDLDLKTGYFVYIVVSSGLLIFNILLFFGMVKHRFFKLWIIAGVLWHIAILSAVLKVINYEASVLIGNICTWLSTVVTAYSITTIAQKKIRLISMILFSLPFFILSIIFHFVFDMPNIRSLFDAALPIICYGYASITLLFLLKKNVAFSGTKQLRIGTGSLGIVLLLEAIFWIWRFITLFSAEFADDIYSTTTLNTTTLIMLPPIKIIIQMSMLFFVISLINLERISLRSNTLIHEQNLIFSRLLWSINHEINTPLGNARLAASYLSKRKNGKDHEGYSILNSSLDEVSKIITERNQVLAPGLEIIDSSRFQMVLGTIQRLLVRSKSTRRIALKYEEVPMDFHVPLAYFFNVLYSIAELLNSCCLFDTDYIEMTLRYYPLSSDNSHSFKIMHWSKSILPEQLKKLESNMEETILEQFDTDYASRLIWLSNYMSSQYHGHYEIARNTNGGETLRISYCLG